MAYRNIFISNEASLRLRNKQLIVDNGSVRLLTITEKQYESMQILLGEFKQSDTQVAYEQLTLL